MKPRSYILFISTAIFASLLLGGCASTGSTPVRGVTQAYTPEPTSTNTPEDPTSAPQNTPTSTDAPATPQPVSEAEPFKAWLSENIANRNFDELRKLIGEDFYFGMYQSEAGKETPENAIRLLKDFFGSNHIEFVPYQEATSALDFDPLSIISPDVKGADYLLAKNVGTDGKDGAIMYIAQKPDGSYYWYGLLVLRGGF
jgi:hypothetical protein